MSLDEAKAYMRVTHDDEDDTIESMTTMAEDIVVQYVDDPGSPAWDSDSVPGPVKAAILEVTTNLYRNRGDDGKADGPLTQRAMWTLRTYRDPPLA